jgi:hypothetical protein
MIGPGGLLLVVPHLFALPVFCFMGGVAKEYITKLGCGGSYFFLLTFTIVVYVYLSPPTGEKK